MLRSQCQQLKSLTHIRTTHILLSPDIAFLLFRQVIFSNLGFLILSSHHPYHSPKMPGSLFKALLAAALATSFLAAARPATPSLQPLTGEARDAALAPLPGVTFRYGPPPASQRSSKRNATDRFRKTRNYSHLHAYSGQRSGQLSATRRLGGAQRAHGGTGYANITATSAFGTQYGVGVTLGQQRLLLDLDTGSSDTWALSSMTNCTDGGAGGGVVVVAPRYCRFGPRYRGNFTYGPAAGEHLYIAYGDGETVEGPLGYLDVTVGGVRVRNQTVGLAGETTWRGNNVSSGVLGLAYPGLTNAFYGPEGHEDPYYAVQYSPVFSSMVDQGLVDAFFSIAINRAGGNSSSAGTVGFGGIPEEIDGVDYGTTAQTDIIVVSHIPLFRSGAIGVDGGWGRHKAHHLSWRRDSC